MFLELKKVSRGRCLSFRCCSMSLTPRRPSEQHSCWLWCPHRIAVTTCAVCHTWALLINFRGCLLICKMGPLNHLNCGFLLLEEPETCANCHVSCKKAIQMPAALLLLLWEPRQKQRLLGTGLFPRDGWLNLGDLLQSRRVFSPVFLSGIEQGLRKQSGVERFLVHGKMSVLPLSIPQFQGFIARIREAQRKDYLFTLASRIRRLVCQKEGYNCIWS